LQEGYKYEGFAIVTQDEYCFTLHRIPNKQSKDVIFFVHGVMDSPLGWVGTNVTNSLAFNAASAGFDVWLASCRNNPPRANDNPDRQGHKYFCYSVNELGMIDMRDQVCKVLSAGMDALP
jgi:Partial alpha/beta-hydrolase lipase region